MADGLDFSFSDSNDAFGGDSFDFGFGPTRGSKDPLAIQEKRNRSMERDLLAAGLAPELLEPRESLFSKTLNFLDKPKQVAMGLLDSAFLKKDLFDVGIPGVIDRSLEERTNAFHILRREGVENPIARGVLGLAAEIVTDPLNLLSFGLKPLASAGGRALSKGGKEVVEKALGELAKKGIEAVPAQQLVANGFSHLGTYVDTMKQIDRLNASKNRLQKLGVINELRSKAEDSFKLFKDILPLGEGFELGSKADVLFAKNRLRLGIGLPFLGHLTGKDLIPLLGEESTFKKAIKTVGNVLNPDRIEFGSIKLPELSPTMLAFLDDTKAIAAKSLTVLSHQLDNIPVVGAVVKKGGKLVKQTVEVGDHLIEGIKDIFFHTANLKPAAKFASKQYEGTLAVADIIGKARTHDVFSDMIDAANAALPNNPNALQELVTDMSDAAIALDRHAGDSILDAAIKSPAERSTFYAELTKIAREGDADKLSDSVRDWLTKVENTHRVDFSSDTFKNLELDSLDVFLKRNAAAGYKALSPRGTEILLRTKNKMKEIYEYEKQSGLGTSFIENYLTHFVTNLQNSDFMKAAKASGDVDFLKKRKYATFQDLLTQAGLSAKTNIMDILPRRIAASELAIAGKNFFERGVLESGMRPDSYYEILKSAVVNPHAAEALKGRGFTLPDPNVAERAIESLKTLTKSEEIAKLSIQSGTLDGLWASKDLPINQKVSLFGLLGQAESDLMLKAKAVGITPQNAFLPLRYLGEIAEEVVIGGEKFMVPQQFKKIYNEMTSTADIVKQATKNSPLLSTFVKWSDSAISMMKRWTLWPFPSFWTQNAIGNSFFNLSGQGSHFFQIGNFAEAHNITLGKGVLNTPNGKLLASDILKFAKEGGLNVNANEYLGVMNAMGDLNIEKAAKQARSVGSNLKKLEIGTVVGKAVDKLQFGFEDMFRFNQFVYEIKKGSLLPDALNRANDVMLNFRNLSRVEKSLFRRFYLFYPWIKASSVKTIEQMVLQPGFISNQIRAARGLSEAMSDPADLQSVDDVDRKEINDIISQEQIAFTIGKDKEGKPVTGTGFGLPLNTLLQQFSISLPRNNDWSEILDTAENNIVRNVQKQFASSNPFIKGAVEQLLTKKNLYFNQPLSRDFLHTLPKVSAVMEKISAYPYTHIPAEMIDNTVMKLLGGVDNGKGGIVVNPTLFYMFSNYVPGLARAISTARRFADENLPLPSALLHTLTGIRVRPTNAQLLRAYEVGDNLQQQINNYSVDTRLKYGNAPIN